MHHSRMLELESQTELLERLQLLTQFSSNFINVTGVSGAGKSWIAQRYLEAWVQDKNQSLLMCHPNQSDGQHRSTILNQLIPGVSLDANLPLYESFSYQMAEESCDMVIVVDDAHLLSDSLLSELWRLVLQSQITPYWTITVVLFSRQNSLEAKVSRLAQGQDLKPVELEIETLTTDDADRFFEHLVVRFVEDDMEKRVRSAYKKVALRPGDIMALGEQKVEKKIIIRSIVGSPFKIAILVLILLLFIAGGYWWMMGNSMPKQNESIIPAVEQTVIPTLTDIPSEQAKLSEQESVLAIETAEDDSDALPPEVLDDASSVGQSDDDKHKRLVITSDVVDALLDNKSASSKLNDSVLPAPDSSSVEPSNESSTSAEPEGISPPVVAFSFARDTLKSFSPHSYTLQLAAVSSPEEVQLFLDKHQLSRKIYVYPTVRNDTEWFIITFDNFPTIQSARDAVSALPEKLQQLDPWAKSLNQVHREIDRVK